MFTGIITDLGEITAREELAAGIRLTIATRYNMRVIPLGASIAHDGACLTVIEKATHSYKVDISPETLDRTTLGKWNVGSKVNLERPVPVGGEFGGHFVTGHVDALGEVVRLEPQDDFWLLDICFPDSMLGYVAEKGSVCVNGVSLTVNAVQGNQLSITLIPHTAQETNLGGLQAGDAVNLEIDLVARYVASLLQAQTAKDSAA